MAGLYHEQFHIGQVFRHAIRGRLTETDNVRFAAMTHNPAALHLDEEYLFRHDTFNQRGDLVATCERSALMMREPVA